MTRDATETQIDTDLPLTDYAVDLLGDRSTPTSSPETPSKPCASCGEPHAEHRLLLTVEWEDYLSEHHGIPYPEEECHVPLCTRCGSRAEILEIAEMNLSNHEISQQQKILDERDRFLETLRPELITNLSVTTTLSNFE